MAHQRDVRVQPHYWELIAVAVHKPATLHFYEPVVLGDNAGFAVQVHGCIG